MDNDSIYNNSIVQSIIIQPWKMPRYTVIRINLLYPYVLMEG